MNSIIQYAGGGPLERGLNMFQSCTPFHRDGNVYNEDASHGLSASELMSSPFTRSWTLADTKPTLSTDSDNSDCSRELNRHLPLAGGLGDLQDSVSAESLSQESLGQIDRDHSWMPRSLVTSRFVASRDGDNKDESSLPEWDGLDRMSIRSSLRFSPDAMAMTSGSPYSCPPVRDDESFGPLAGIAQLPNRRGGSMGDASPLPSANHQNFNQRRSMPFQDVANPPRHEASGRLFSPSDFSPPRSAYSPAPSAAWLTDAEVNNHEAFIENGSMSGSMMGSRSNSLIQSPFLTEMNSPRDSRDFLTPDAGFAQFAGFTSSRTSTPTRGSVRRDLLPQPVMPPHMAPKPMAPQFHQQQSTPEEYPPRHRQSHKEARSPYYPTEPSQQLTDGNIYQVQFKRCYRCFKLFVNSPLSIQLGEFVIVEADRGEDLGVVIAIAPWNSPLAVSIYAASSLSMRMTESDFSKKILRIANMQERADLQFKRQQEMILLGVCRERAREPHALPISLVDAEYQFDRNKLVLYYNASRRIDFREFVRDLFAVYKTRIWMEQAATTGNFNPNEAVAEALQTGELHLDNFVPPGDKGHPADPTGYYTQGPALMVERRKSSPAQVGIFQNQQQNQARLSLSSREVPNSRMSYTSSSLYEQNLKQQEMRLAQHPQRQLNRHSVDQKCKELQLQKERELNEEFDRGAENFASLSFSQVLPY